MVESNNSVKCDVDVKLPKNYSVILLNDDVTPMDVVVTVIMTVFKRGYDEALRLTKEAHNNGESYIGLYTYDIASTKVLEARKKASSYGCDLKFRVEEC